MAKANRKSTGSATGLSANLLTDERSQVFNGRKIPTQVVRGSFQRRGGQLGPQGRIDLGATNDAGGFNSVRFFDDLNRFQPRDNRSGRLAPVDVAAPEPPGFFFDIGQERAGGGVPVQDSGRTAQASRGATGTFQQFSAPASDPTGILLNTIFDSAIANPSLDVFSNLGLDSRDGTAVLQFVQGELERALLETGGNTEAAVGLAQARIQAASQLSPAQDISGGGFTQQDIGKLISDAVGQLLPGLSNQTPEQDVFTDGPALDPRIVTDNFGF